MSYSFVDSKVKANVEYYYRLKQIDFDGRTEMSDIRSAKMIDESAMTIGEFYPNPV
ncbi:MAG: hypothetical protein IPN86_10365 [Saprospiraceae bacterium]|nr:hypothetical protein [Saprospiraceae bacterium]